MSKLIRIALIFALMTVMLGQGFAYALRLPLGIDKERQRKVLHEITQVLPGEKLPISIALYELQNSLDSLNLNPKVNPGTPIGDTFLERLDSGLLRQMIQSDIQRKTGENNKHLVYVISLAQKEDVAWVLKTLEELLPGEERDEWAISLIAINIREQSLQTARGIVNSYENKLKIQLCSLKIDISDATQISALTELVSKNQLLGMADGVMHNTGSAVLGTREKFYFQFLRKLCGDDAWLEVDREELRSAIDLKKLAPIEAKEYLEGDERYINRIRSCGFIPMPTGRDVSSGIFRVASGSGQEPVNKDLVDALSDIFSEEDIKNKALEVLSKSGEFSEENLLKVEELISEECESAIKSDIELSDKIKYLWIDERMLRDAQFLAYYSVNSYFNKRISKDIPVITRKLAYKALLIQHLYGAFEVKFFPGYTYYKTKETGFRRVYAYPETVNPELAIVPFADLSRLDKTHVLFLGSDIIQNPSVFKETLEKLESNKSNVPVILLNDGDLFIDKAFVKSVLNNAELEDSSFRAIKNLDFLKQTVLDRTMVPVSGVRGLKCVPLTVPICEIYKELGELVLNGGRKTLGLLKDSGNTEILDVEKKMSPAKETRKSFVQEDIKIKEVNKDDETLIEKIVTMDTLGFDTSNIKGSEEFTREVEEICYGSLKLFAIINQRTAELAGYLLYRPTDKNAIYIKRFFTVPEYRKMGITTLMLRYCTEQFASIELHWKPDQLPDRAKIYNNFLKLLTGLNFKESYFKDYFVWKRHVEILEEETVFSIKASMISI